MTSAKVLLGALLIAGSQFVNAAGASSNVQFSNVECTQVSADLVRVTCKLNDVELPTSLINYDVKDKDGNTVASGTGNSVHLDTAKLGADSDYSITVYSVINGDIVSQTVSRKTPAGK